MNPDNLGGKREINEDKPKALEGKTHVETEFGTTTPSIGVFEDLLATAGAQLSHFQMSEADVAAKAGERKKLGLELGQVHREHQKDLKTAKNDNSLADITSQDYDRLEREQVIVAAEAVLLKKADNFIAKIKRPKKLPEDLQNNLRLITEKRAELIATIEARLEEKKIQFEREREERIANLAVGYAEKTMVLEQAIQDLESNPRVKDFLEDEAIAQRRNELAEIAKKEKEELQGFLNGIARVVQSVSDRNKNAFIRVAEIVKDPEIKSKLIEALEDKDGSASDSLFRVTKNKVVLAITKGELGSPAEVVPWEMPSSVDYIKELGNLKQMAKGGQSGVARLFALAARQEQEQRNNVAEKLSQKYKETTMEFTVFEKLFGRRYSYDAKGRKTLGMIWAAFDQRTEGDKQLSKKGEGQKVVARSMDEIEVDRKIQDILGKGGFKVNIPPAKGKDFGRREGAVLMKKVGQNYQVEDFAIHRGAGLLVKGTSYTLTNMPLWLKAALPNHMK